MIPDRWQRIKEVFQAALERPATARAGFLAEACGDDAALRGEVESLLASHAQAVSFIETPALDAAAQRAGVADTSPPTLPMQQPDSDVVALPADSFPGYELTREIHRGGQGVVYQAIQKATKRKVAIKVMHAGRFAGPHDRTRFEREVQILAALKHPNIVTIHDSGAVAGLTGHGLPCPYLVMDYISGQPLDAYLESGEHSIEELLRLFAKICDAINAAHLRGVIHRDSKPGNIRVDSSGEPHVLDFGLAKLATGEVTDATRPQVVTLTGQFLGSLPWASPEQAEGLPEKIDIRTDVYSLGVILYQMLTRRFPYEVVGNMRDVLNNILRAAPTRPSTIRHQINDEVETIVLKCLAKERERRYQSAGELARDIGRYLAGEPVEAKRDSAWYFLRKQFHRHKVPVGVGAGFVLLVFGFAIVMSLQAHSERRARAEADRARHTAQAEKQRGDEQRQLAEASAEQARREAANARFRLLSARAQAVDAWHRFESFSGIIRRGYDFAAFVPDSVRQEYSDTVLPDAESWLRDLLPELFSPGSAPPEPGLFEQLTEFLAHFAHAQVDDPRAQIGLDWARANRTRIDKLAEATRLYRFPSALHFRDAPSTLVEGQPTLGIYHRASVALLAGAVVDHLDGQGDAAIERLRAARRIATSAGDAHMLIGPLAEYAIRSVVYQEFRQFMVDGAVAGALPEAYLEFIRSDAPFPPLDVAALGEGRMARQVVDEIFVVKRGGDPPRVDAERARQFHNRDFTTDELAALAAADYDTTVAELAEMEALTSGLRDATVAELERADLSAFDALMRRNAALMLVGAVPPRAFLLRARACMDRDATIIAAAIAAYRVAHGAWPATIDDALGEFCVQPLRRDYYDHDFVYRIVADYPVLYSVGPDGRDDGGTQESRGKRPEVPGDFIYLPPRTRPP